jgi:hypothetical protein
MNVVTPSPFEVVDRELLEAARKYTAAVRAGAGSDALPRLMHEFHAILTRHGWTHEDWARKTAKPGPTDK